MTSNRLAIGGLDFMALAMIGAVLLATDVLFSTTAAGRCRDWNHGALRLLWYAMPRAADTGRAGTAHD